MWWHGGNLKKDGKRKNIGRITGRDVEDRKKGRGLYLSRKKGVDDSDEEYEKRKAQGLPPADQ